MNTLYRLIIIAILLPQSVLANDVEYAIRIRDANPEYGTRIPKELCEKEARSPCRLPVYLLYDVVSNIKSTRGNLSSAAYSAFKRNSKNAQVVWEFNLCKPLWDKKIHCVEVLGYLVIKKDEVVFYVFQKSQRVLAQ